jgi:hypothetical protein
MTAPSARVGAWQQQAALIPLPGRLKQAVLLVGEGDAADGEALVAQEEVRDACTACEVDLSINACMQKKPPASCANRHMLQQLTMRIAHRAVGEAGGVVLRLQATEVVVHEVRMRPGACAPDVARQ